MVDEADAGNGLKKESKYGLAVQFVLSVLATGAIGYLGTLNVSTVPGWATATWPEPASAPPVRRRLTAPNPGWAWRSSSIQWQLHPEGQRLKRG
jgi:hypothetical protein